MFCNGKVDIFRCLHETAANPQASTKAANDRVQNWGGVYHSYTTMLSSRKHGAQRTMTTPLSDAFYASENLQNLRRGVQVQTFARTKEIPVLDFDRDKDIQELLFQICAGNQSMPWTTGTVDLMNRSFVGQMTTNVVIRIHDRWRIDIFRYQPSYERVQPYGLSRNPKVREVDSTYYTMTDPRARDNALLLKLQADERCKNNVLGPCMNDSVGIFGA